MRAFFNVPAAAVQRQIGVAAYCAGGRAWGIQQNMGKFFRRVPAFKVAQKGLRAKSGARQIGGEAFEPAFGGIERRNLCAARGQL